MKSRYKEIIAKKPVSVILVPLLFTEIIIRICDYFINRILSSPNDFFVHNYSIRLFLFVPVFMVVVFIMLKIESSKAVVRGDLDLVKGIFTKDYIISKIIMFLILIGTLDSIISFAFQTVSGSSANYAIYSLNKIGDSVVLVYSIWFSVLILWWFLYNNVGKRFLELLCPILLIVLLYRIIISCFLVGPMEEWNSGMASDFIGSEIGGPVGLLFSLESFADTLINGLCCVLILLICRISDKPVRKIMKISAIIGVILFAVGFTDVPNAISFLVGLF